MRKFHQRDARKDTTLERPPYGGDMAGMRAGHRTSNLNPTHNPFVSDQRIPRKTRQMLCLGHPNGELLFVRQNRQQFLKSP